MTKTETFLCLGWVVSGGLAAALIVASILGMLLQQSLIVAGGVMGGSLGGLVWCVFSLIIVLRRT